MCGIIGYTGGEPALPILVQGLRALEYRGYDSGGVALESNGEITAVKTKGRISRLEEKLKNTSLPPSSCGIGHTRWATHGAPSDINAHPHSSDRVSIVHNGIIENCEALSKELASLGYHFRSETDTEVAAFLIDSIYKECKDPSEALFAASERMVGSFAIGAIFCDRPGTVYAIRRDSPLIVAHCNGASFIASDIPALLPYTDRIFRVPEETVVEASKSGVSFSDRRGNPVSVTAEKVNWNVDQAQKSGFPHFMLKEIFEEPEAIVKTVRSYLSDGLPHFPCLDVAPERIHVVACGTAMHAGLVGKTLIERISAIPTEVEIASEFRYREPLLKEDELVILLSQSGETADTLAALRYAKSKGIKTLAIVNVTGSSLAREADDVLYTYAGPEIAVASTKAYSVQCALLALIAVNLAISRGMITDAEAVSLCKALYTAVPRIINEVIGSNDRIRALAEDYLNCEHLFYIGRGIDHDLAAEGSLKLKEISYVHSEAYAAGELKHGTISLITEGTPVIAVITEKRLAPKTLSGIREVISRGAKVLVVASADIADDTCSSLPCHALLTVPSCDVGLLNFFPAVTSLQLLAYHVAAQKGLDVDKPRNLAKSVTVE